MASPPKTMALDDSAAVRTSSSRPVQMGGLPYKQIEKDDNICYNLWEITWKITGNVSGGNSQKNVNLSHTNDDLTNK